MLKQIKNKIIGKKRSLILLVALVGVLTAVAAFVLTRPQNDSSKTAILSVSSPNFSNFSANLNIDQAVFNFTYTGSSTFYQIDLSTYADMSWDTYLNFAPGKNSPMVLNTPTSKWDKYKCGQTLYWRVLTSHREENSSIQSATVNCSVPTPTPTPTPTLTSTPTPSPTAVSSIPTVRITYPGNYVSIKRYTPITIIAQALDINGIQKVEFRVNSRLICTSTSNTSNFTCNWSITDDYMAYNIEAKAYNKQGKTNTHRITVYAASN